MPLQGSFRLQFGLGLRRPPHAERIRQLHLVLLSERLLQCLDLLQSLPHGLGPASLESPHLQQVDFIRPVDDSHGPRVGPHVRQRRVLANAGAAVNLDGKVDDAAQDLGHEDLGFGDFPQGQLGVAVVDFERRVEYD